MTEFRNDNGYGELHIVGWDEPKNDKDCDHDWQCDDSIVLATYPPKRQYVCSKCGAKKTEPAYTVPVKTDDLVEDLRLKLEESRALTGKLEAEVRLAEAKIERLASNQKPLEAKIENQARELTRFNEMFAQLKWFKNPETGEYQYMSGPMMLKVIKRAEAKVEKWKQRALEAEEHVMDLSDLIEDLEEGNRDLQARIFKEKLDADDALEIERQEHERTKMSLVNWRHEYSELADEFVALVKELYNCCVCHPDCIDCGLHSGALEHYEDISEAIKRGIRITDV